MCFRGQEYIERAQMLVTNENLLLQTLGFDVNVVHPHTHVVKYCQILKTQKDLAHTSYFMATNRYAHTRNANRVTIGTVGTCQAQYFAFLKEKLKTKHIETSRVEIREF